MSLPRASSSRARWVVPAAALACAAIVTSACFENDPACYAGDYRACTCPGAPASGYQACVATDGWAACVCDGTTPGVDGKAPDADAGAEAAPPAKKALLEACTQNEECETGLCFSFNQKGQRCSKACTSSADCPPPSTGCNLQGICKAP
jgi:hypothetical protein